MSPAYSPAYAQPVNFGGSAPASPYQNYDPGIGGLISAAIDSAVPNMQTILLLAGAVIVVVSLLDAD